MLQWLWEWLYQVGARRLVAVGCCRTEWPGTWQQQGHCSVWPRPLQPSCCALPLRQEALYPFLVDAGAAVEGAGGSDALLSAFLSYWVSLNWQQVGCGAGQGGRTLLMRAAAAMAGGAGCWRQRWWCLYGWFRPPHRTTARACPPLQVSFHTTSPAALATLRLHLASPLGHAAAAVLFRELDFAPVLAKVRLFNKTGLLLCQRNLRLQQSQPWHAHTCMRPSPPPPTAPCTSSWLPHLQAAPAPRPSSVQRVYSLGDEEEEEDGSQALDAAARDAWAAELGLLALHSCVLLPKQVWRAAGGARWGACSLSRALPLLEDGWPAAFAEAVLPPARSPIRTSPRGCTSCCWALLLLRQRSSSWPRSRSQRVHTSSGWRTYRR